MRNWQNHDDYPKKTFVGWCRKISNPSSFPLICKLGLWMQKFIFVNVVALFFKTAITILIPSFTNELLLLKMIFLIPKEAVAKTSNQLLFQVYFQIQANTNSSYANDAKAKVLLAKKKNMKIIDNKTVQWALVGCNADQSAHPAAKTTISNNIFQ